MHRFIFLKMKVIDLLENGHINEERHFSFEVLPPLKGNGTEALFRTIDTLKEFNPQYINITTHHSEYVYKELEDGNCASAYAAVLEPLPLPLPSSNAINCQ